MRKTIEHHWSGMTPDPDKYYGFIYEIVNNETGKRYIGRKFYHKYRKRKRWCDNDWHFYTGSSNSLNKDIKKFGKKIFSFTIIDQYITRGGVMFGEVEWMILLGVLTKKNEEGERVYYNQSVPGIRFVPKESHTEETKRKLAKNDTHRFVHTDSGDTFEGTKRDFLYHLGICPSGSQSGSRNVQSNLTKVINGTRNSFYGWELCSTNSQ